MIIGECGFAGGWNGRVGLWMNPNTGLSSGRRATKVEATPRYTPCPLRAGPSITPTVMLQVSGATSGDEEIE